MLHAFFHQFKSCQQGAISIIFALLLPLLVGFIALATDTGVWYINQRNMQSAADIAAISAGQEIGNVDYYVLEQNAKDEAARNGFGETDGVTFDVNIPPESGAYTGNNMAMEVIMTQEQPRFFAVLNASTDPVATARSVALKATSGTACVLALNPSAANAVSFQGNPDVSLDGCIIASNSNSSSAVNISGSAELSAQSLRTVGNYSVNGAADLNLEEPAVTGSPSIADPYADLADPSYGGCNQNNYKAKNTQTLSPGVYCGGLTVNANADITLSPGTYYIHGGDFKVNGNAELTGSGVTIILTGTGSGVGNMDINGTADLTLSAPTSGDYEGILVYQDRDAPAGGTNKINGGSTNNLVGTMYFPNQSVEFSGNSSGASSCLRLVADTVSFRGNSSMSHNCATTVGGEDITTEVAVTIVE